MLEAILKIFHPEQPAAIPPPEAHAAAVANAHDDELQLTDECVQLIERMEGCVLHAYPDPASGGEPWTIGYGHTGPDVYPGLKITSTDAQALLEKDLDKFAGGVARLIGIMDTTSAQYSAMVSLAYNIGLGGFKKSSVLRFHNAGQNQKAADAFLLWNKASGKVMPGLVRRRHEERAMYLGIAP